MRRRGFTLTELLVVMGMTSVVLTVSLGVLHRVMREQKVAERENAMHRVAERLSARLRQDIHRADVAELTPPSEEARQRLLLNQSNENTVPNENTVKYVVRENALERTATGPGRPTHRDSFNFPDNYRLEFARDSSGRISFAVYALPQAYLATAADQPSGVVSENDVRRAVMRVEASIGRDHRFTSATEESE